MRSDDFFSTRRIRFNAASAKVKTCSQCGLWRGKQNPRMKPYGDFRMKILNVGEAPGETEDYIGKQWQGKMGGVLKDKYKEFDVNLFKDCININAVNCRPTLRNNENRAPSDQEINNCRRSVINLIEERHPKVIMLLGNAAMKSVIGGRWQKDLGKISRWTDWAIPDRDFNCWIYVSFHPSFTERGDKELETIWTQSIRRGLNLVNKKLPTFKDERKQIKIISDLGDLRDKLRSPFAFDYETTGLKPHNHSVHEIVCGSISFGDEDTYAFMMSERNKRILKAWLNSKNYKKIAANMKFEHTWSRELLDCKVRGWIWDTMLAAHCLDNRAHISGLKFQVYVNFGLIDYDKEVSSYLESTNKKNGNSTNRIKELIKTSEGTKKLLTYCGMDSLFEYRLAQIQMRKLKFNAS